MGKNNREMKTSLLFTTMRHGTLKNRQIIFGVPENIQRISSIQKTNLSQVHSLMLPSLSSDHAGGLNGLYFKFDDLYKERANYDKPQLKVFGPKGIIKTVDLSQPIINDMKKNMVTYEFPDNLQDREAQLI